jgi:microcystin degradation protein MlrC
MKDDAMTAPGSESNFEKRQSLTHVGSLVEEWVNRTNQSDPLDIYEELLMTIWNRIMPTLGRVTVIAIVERSLVVTTRRYPQIRYVRLQNHGVEFSELRQHVDEMSQELLHESLRELVTNLIYILAMLTGDILVRQLIRELEGDRGNDR